MAEHVSRAARWLRSLFTRPLALPVGECTVVDGVQATRLAAQLAGARVQDSLGAAVGAALTGQRATAWVRQEALGADPTLLTLAGDRCAPLVVVAEAGGPGWAQAADAGWVLLLARNAQEALDLFLIGQSLTETALVPVLLGVEARWNQGVPQVVSVPEGVTAWLGAAGDAIESPTEAQRLYFGAERRRVVRWHDLERPRLLGAAMPPALRARQAAALDSLWRPDTPGLLVDAEGHWLGLSGRTAASVQTHRVDGARLVIVAVGAASETAEGVADQLRSQGSKVGAVSVRCLAPFPAARLAAQVPHGARVVVLDGLGETGSTASALWTGVRQALGAEVPTHRLRIAGALRGADLALACRQLLQSGETGTWLGLQPPRAAHPRQQAWLDELGQVLPHAAGLGVRSSEPLDLRVPGSITLRLAGDPALAQSLGPVLEAALGGALCGHRDGPGTLVLTWSARRQSHPGEGVPIDLEVPPGPEHTAWRAGAVLAALERLGASVRLPRAVAAWRQVDPSDDAGLALAAGFEAGLPPAPAADAPAVADLPAPLAVRRLTGDDATADALPAFYARVGSLSQDQIAVDPALAVAAMPPLTAAFARLAETRAALPVLDPSACTACGGCWASCPEGALAATTVTPRALLDTAVSGAVGAGTELGSLRRLASGVAGAASERVRSRSQDNPLPDAGGLLVQAIGTAVDTAGLAPAAAETTRAAAEALAAPWSGLPLVAAGPTFDGPEQRKPGSGELLALVLEPETCTGCGACATACDAQALVLAPQTPAALALARRQRQAFEQLPDPGAETLARLAADADVGDHAALLLSQQAALACGGGAGTDPGSGPRLALRVALAAGEHVLQPRITAHHQHVVALGSELGQALATELSAVLPTADLSALGTALAAGDGSVAELLQRMEDAGAAARLGAGRVSRLRRLTWLKARIDGLAHRLATAGGGLGRARAGVVVAQSVAERLGVGFPHNPFQAPALVAPGAGLEPLVLGLLEGQISQAAEAIALVRQARRELDDPAQAARSAPPAAPAWSELTPDEQAICPPVLLVLDDTHPLPSSLVRAGLPLRILVLADAPGDGHAELSALAQGLAGALVAQDSLADGDALARSWLHAWAHPGPSLGRVHAPSPALLGLAPDQALAEARRVLDAGDWACWRLDPESEGPLASRVQVRHQGGGALLLELFGPAGTPVEDALSALEATHAASLDALQQRHAEELEALRQSLEAGISGRLEQRLMALAGYPPVDGTA